jgi:hypothetical protein
MSGPHREGRTNGGQGRSQRTIAFYYCRLHIRRLSFVRSPCEDYCVKEANEMSASLQLSSHENIEPGHTWMLSEPHIVGYILATWGPWRIDSMRACMWGLLILG